MINQKFLNCIKKGLGRAYLELECATNREEYKETLIYACFKDCSNDFVVEGSKGRYLYDLVSLLDDKNHFKQLIINFLKNNLPNRNIFAQLVDILHAFFDDGDTSLGEFFSEYYTTFITTKKWCKNKIMCFEYLCIVMCEIFDYKKVIQILKDIERLKIDQNKLLWFVSVVSTEYRKNKAIKKYIREEKIEHKEYNHTFEEFISLDEEARLYGFPYWATDDEYEKCVKFLKETKDKDKIITILSEFQDVHCPRRLPEDLLFSMLGISSEIDHEVYCTLSYMKSKRVEKHALTLLNDKKNVGNVARMLMTNYKKGYKQLVIDLCKKVKFHFKEHNYLTFDVVDFMYNTKKDLPNEILFYVYEKSYSAFYREYIVDCMKKRKLLTKEILVELLYDSDFEIRQKANRWLRNKVI